MELLVSAFDISNIKNNNNKLKKKKNLGLIDEINKPKILFLNWNLKLKKTKNLS